MSAVVGIALFVFGGVGAFIVTTRFARATFLRAAYVFMSLGGLCGAVWGISHNLSAGIVAVIVLLIGGVLGLISSLRKEVRLIL